MSVPRDTWAAGAAYEPFIGRWSRPVAAGFVQWLDVPAGRRWLDVGCGTGALTEIVLATAEPRQVEAIDPSEGFVRYAAAHIPDPRARFSVGTATDLPGGPFDVITSGLVLNFVPDPAAALAAMRSAAPSGLIAAYVWDYAEGMGLLREFWDAAIRLDPEAVPLDEAHRFPLCQPEPLGHLFREAGLDQVAVRAIEVPTVFGEFADFWSPFLGGQGPAPTYVGGLTEDRRIALREALRARLGDGVIRMRARAWAVRGTST